MCILLWVSCSGLNNATLAVQGRVSNTYFTEEIPFYYLGKHMFIDATINGKSYTFLMDTGWDITHIDKSLIKELNFIPRKRIKGSNKVFGVEKFQYGTMQRALMIGDIAFQNMAVGIQDMSFLKPLESRFSDQRKLYGVIGANVLRKAGYWQIDYRESKIRFSDQSASFLPVPDALKIDMIPGSTGVNRIEVKINGVSEHYVFDTGSFGSFSANPSYLERIQKTDQPLVEISHDDGPERRKYQIDTAMVASIQFPNQQLLIEEGISSLIGNDFLDDFMVTVDWMEDILYLQPN